MLNENTCDTKSTKRDVQTGASQFKKTKTASSGCNACNWRPFDLLGDGWWWIVMDLPWKHAFSANGATPGCKIHLGFSTSQRTYRPGAAVPAGDVKDSDHVKFWVEWREPHSGESWRFRSRQHHQEQKQKSACHKCNFRTLGCWRQCAVQNDFVDVHSQYINNNEYITICCSPCAQISLGLSSSTISPYYQSTSMRNDPKAFEGRSMDPSFHPVMPSNPIPSPLNVVFASGHQRLFILTGLYHNRSRLDDIEPVLLCFWKCSTFNARTRSNSETVLEVA